MGNRHQEELACEYIADSLCSKADMVALYHDVFKHEEFLIVMVLSMSGGKCSKVFFKLTVDDPQPNLPVIDAVNRARPGMKQVFGILTKADLTKKGKTDRSAWSRMVAGKNEAMEGVKPQHGWFPLYLKDAGELIDEGMSKEKWLAEQRLFFQRSDLLRLADECGFALGWEPTSEKIYQLFADLVVSQ